jgi:biofilm PGA synthesis lipoprotein PgaB
VLVLVVFLFGPKLTRVESQPPVQPDEVSSRAFERPTNSAATRILAAQVSLFHCRDLEAVEGRIRDLAAAGFNTLIVRVFHNEGDRFYGFATPRFTSGVYFKTEYAPVVDDVLGPVCRLAHAHGLEVFAWMTTRYANYGFEKANGLRAFQYDFEQEQIVPAKGFNLFREEVIARLEGLYRDLARYPVDGILFQDDLILRHNEGFSPEARQLYLRDHGYSPEPWLLYEAPTKYENGKAVPSSYTERFWEWSRWKNRRILVVAARLISAAREVNQSLRFAINIYYESILDPEKAMAWYSQSLEEARFYPFDYFSIMAYHRQMREELDLSLDETVGLIPHLARKAVAMAGDRTRVLMKIQVIDWKEARSLPETETETILRSLADNPDIHIALVPFQPDVPVRSLMRVLRQSESS